MFWLLSSKWYGRMQVRRLRLVGASWLSLAVVLGPAVRTYAEPDTSDDERVYATAVQSKTQTIGVILGTGQLGASNGGVNPFTYDLSQLLSPWYASATVLYKQHELHVSVFPGISYSWRTSITGLYASIGGGIAPWVIGNGAMEPVLALATGMGYMRCAWDKVCFGIEYRNSLGQSWPWMVPIIATHWSVRGLIGMLIDF